MLSEIRGVLADSPPGSQELSASEQVLFDMVELCIHQAPLESWRALQARSEKFSVEQEPLEVLDMMALTVVRRGRLRWAAAGLRGREAGGSPAAPLKAWRARTPCMGASGSSATLDSPATICPASISLRPFRPGAFAFDATGTMAVAPAR